MNHTKEPLGDGGWEQKAIDACAGMEDPSVEIAALRARVEELEAGSTSWRRTAEELEGENKTLYALMRSGEQRGVEKATKELSTKLYAEREKVKMLRQFVSHTETCDYWIGGNCGCGAYKAIVATEGKE